MKNFLYILAAAICLCACSNIEEDDRLAEVGFLPAKYIKRNVLIEDYTGQRCPNCPTAASLIEKLEAGYSNKDAGYDEAVIAVAIHSGNMGKGDLFHKVAQDGQHFFDLLNDPNLPQPAAQVSRASEVFTGNAVTANLHKSIRELLAQETPVEILDAVVKSGAEAGSYDIAFNVSSQEDLDVAVQVWAIESGVVSYQSMPDGSRNNEYVHNSVFRKSLTELDGTQSSLKKNAPVAYTYNFMPAADWKADNMAMVIIVSKPGGEVLQVKKVPLTAK